MDAIKQIISALAGEDISAANQDRIIQLTEQLHEAVHAWQCASLPAFDRVHVVLPSGFAPYSVPTPVSAPDISVAPAPKVKAMSPAASSPKKDEVPSAVPSSIVFSVPRPPATIRVAEPQQPVAVETYKPPVPDPVAPLASLPEAEAILETAAPSPEVVVWELAVPEIAETPPQDYQEVAAIVEAPSSETKAFVDADQQPDHVVQMDQARSSAAAQEAMPPAPAEPEAYQQEAVLAPALQMMEALLAASNQPAEPVESDAVTIDQPIELTIDQDMLDEQLALEALDLRPEAPVAEAPKAHAPYLPKSMQLDHMDDLLVLPKPRPVKAPAPVAPVQQTADVNERLQTRRRELAELLQEPKITDLRKGISINERYQYIQNLFRSDEAMFERSIKTLNGFNILAEAQYWMQRELVIKLGWNDEDELVQQFYQLVSRRFRSI